MKKYFKLLYLFKIYIFSLVDSVVNKEIAIIPNLTTKKTVTIKALIDFLTVLFSQAIHIIFNQDWVLLYFEFSIPFH